MPGIAVIIAAITISIDTMDRWGFVSPGVAHRGTAGTPSSNCNITIVGSAEKRPPGSGRSTTIIYNNRNRLGVSSPPGTASRWDSREDVSGIAANLSAWNCRKDNFRGRYSTSVRWGCRGFWGHHNSNIVGSPKCLSGSVHRT